MLAIILPGEQWPQFRKGIPGILPRVTPNPIRRGKKRIVAELVKADFGCHNWDAGTITQPISQGVRRREMRANWPASAALQGDNEFGYSLASTDFSLTPCFSWVLTTLERGPTASAVFCESTSKPLKRLL